MQSKYPAGLDRPDPRKGRPSAAVLLTPPDSLEAQINKYAIHLRPEFASCIPEGPPELPAKPWSFRVGKWGEAELCRENIPAARRYVSMLDSAVHAVDALRAREVRKAESEGGEVSTLFPLLSE